ncbi:hypothetical protein GCM10020367_20610 [Streptomyces sannanensis]|uniref:Uncharacterized protein n=1 Tax=Streptomyces sannanensis TaxID=285536 RepID=A0ABP6S969_9ACTN
MTDQTTPDPLAYDPTGYRCGCGKDAHSNLVPCQPDTSAVTECPGVGEYGHSLTGRTVHWGCCPASS